MSVAPSLDEIVDAAAARPLPRRVLLLCLLIAIADGFDLLVMASVTPQVALAWGLPDRALGPALAAALLGMAIGATAFGSVGDRCGRRPTLLGAFVAVGVLTLATSAVRSPGELIAVRLLTGVALGASMANALALAAEYFERPRRARLLTLMFSGISVGGVLGGVVASLVLESFGWRGVFVIGGAMPLALSLVLTRALPESPRFLLTRGDPHGRLPGILAALGHMGPLPAVPPEDRSDAPGRIATLLAPDLRRTTLLIWAVFFSNLFALYLLTTWLPSLLRAADWSMRHAVLGVAIFQAGGIVGGFALGVLIDRLGARTALSSGYVVTAAVLAGAALTAPGGAMLLVITVLAGAGIVGAQFCINALAATTYPTPLRSTGVGAALGVGRIGSILSPLAGAALLAGPNSMQLMFAAAALAALICAAATSRVHGRAAPREARLPSDA